jgi:hypothetical protein
VFVTLQALIILILSVAAFGIEVFALVDCITRKPGKFVSAGKLTKPLWLIMLGVAAALGFIALPYPIGGGQGALGLLSIIGVVAAAVYLTDVRPAVRGATGRDGGRSGPYGPW